jgi:predicted nucleotidyltransferase
MCPAEHYAQVANNYDLLPYFAKMTVMNPIIQQLSKVSPAIRKQFRLQRLGVFGSYARGNTHTGSDLDVIYEIEENASLSFRDFILLEETIARHTGVSDIDLVRLQNINPLVWLTVKETVIYV